MDDAVDGALLPPNASPPPVAASASASVSIDAVDAVDAARIAAACAGGRIGVAVRWHERVGSTMDAAAAWAAAGAPDGAVVVADEQTAGRGRHGRAWLAPPGSALMLSIVLRPVTAPGRVHQAVMAVALGAVEAVERIVRDGLVEAGVRSADAAVVGLKWPNDLVVVQHVGDDEQTADAKLAGLLAETVWGADGRPVVIVGLGLNVHQPAGDLPGGATSLRLLRPAGAAPIDRTALATTLLAAADRHYADLLAGIDLVPRWAARVTTIGRTVTVREAVTGDVVVDGVAERVADDGALVVRAAGGGAVTVRAGDVTLRAVVGGDD
ncbi:MAG: biotin--[acetyl-CoA-carboxylase] ligase [Ardenticatenales bacterium]